MRAKLTFDDVSFRVHQKGAVLTAVCNEDPTIEVQVTGCVGSSLAMQDLIQEVQERLNTQIRPNLRFQASEMRKVLSL